MSWQQASRRQDHGQKGAEILQPVFRPLDVHHELIVEVAAGSLAVHGHVSRVLLRKLR